MTPLYHASFNYFVPAQMDSEPFEQDIADGRAFDNPGWETSGFELRQHQSGVTDWGDEHQVKETHYDEISALARSLTGADHALVGNHILRNPEQAKIHEDLAPIQFVHSDFAASYGDRMRAFYASDSEDARAALNKADITPAQVAAARRMVILQFWRNLGPAVMDLPIAFCDARTVSADELVPLAVQDYAGGGFDFDTLAVKLPKGRHHAWYTFPDMQIDEIVVFRTYDSNLLDSGKPFWTPHSAFRNPQVEPGRPARYSVEVRATCLWLD